MKQFILSQGGALKNFKGFTANTFKSFGETKFINETLIASKDVHLGKNVSVYNTDTLFTNLDETGIDITFYGTKTIPSGISNIHFYVGTGEERIHFNNDITYEEIETGGSSGDLGYEEIGDDKKWLETRLVSALNEVCDVFVSIRFLTIWGVRFFERFF